MNTRAGASSCGSPRTRAVAIFREDGVLGLLTGEDVLREEARLPGFELPLTELFAE